MNHDIFISYAEEDAVRVEKLAFALEAEGFNVRWKRSVSASGKRRGQIDSAVDNARIVIAVWTRSSAGPAGEIVRDEANRAIDRDALLPVLMEKTQTPIGFSEMQSINLINWRGSAKNVFFRDLVSIARAKMQGMPPPKPRGPLTRLRNRVLAGASPILVIGAVFAFGTDVLSIQENVCSASFAQPALSDQCGAWGLGGKPTRLERLAWQDLDTSDCDALRKHMTTYPNGAYHGRAADIVSSAAIQKNVVWEQSVKRLPIFVPSVSNPTTSEEGARALVAQSAEIRSENACRGFAATSSFRFSSSSFEIGLIDCVRGQAGYLCSVEGDAVCEVEVRGTIDIEVCAGG